MVTCTLYTADRFLMICHQVPTWADVGSVLRQRRSPTLLGAASRGRSQEC